MTSDGHPRAPSALPPFAVHLAARTDAGVVRASNEDHFFVVDIGQSLTELGAIRHLGPDGTLLGVCDGMGGHAAGEVASRMAGETIAERMHTHARGLDDDQLATELCRSVEKAHHAIVKASANNPLWRRMGTTCTVACIRATQAIIAQVGDSRAYLFRNGKLTRLTEDQSLAAEAEKLGMRDAVDGSGGEALGANILLQAVGTAESLQVALTTTDVQEGDRLLLCSDGLWGLVSDDKLRGVLGSPITVDACAEALVNLANAAGGRDNITAVVCELGARRAASSLQERPASGRRTLLFAAAALVTCASIAAALAGYQQTEGRPVAIRKAPVARTVSTEAQTAFAPATVLPSDLHAAEESSSLPPAAEPQAPLGSKPRTRAKVRTQSLNDASNDAPPMAPTQADPVLEPWQRPEGQVARSPFE